VLLTVRLFIPCVTLLFLSHCFALSCKGDIKNSNTFSVEEPGDAEIWTYLNGDMRTQVKNVLVEAFWVH
jgi:hypothetical protein